MAEELYLIEATRQKRGDRPAGIARFVVTAVSRYAALNKLRVHYDTTDLDSLTARPIAGVLPIAGAMVHDMMRRPAETDAPPPQEARADDDEPWRQG